MRRQLAAGLVGLSILGVACSPPSFLRGGAPAGSARGGSLKKTITVDPTPEQLACQSLDRLTRELSSGRFKAEDVSDAYQLISRMSLVVGMAAQAKSASIREPALRANAIVEGPGETFSAVDLEAIGKEMDLIAAACRQNGYEVAEVK
ncbi:MAG: hypothetical protein ACRDIF_05595 [Actinomycetota bacterium]